MSLQENRLAGVHGAVRPTDPGLPAPRPVILFDELCDLCNSGVTWIRRRARAGAGGSPA